MYKVAEAVTLEKNKAKRKYTDTSGEKKGIEPEKSGVKINETHSDTQKEKDQPQIISTQRTVKPSTEKRHIKPQLAVSARPMTFPSEAKRIATCANDLWVSQVFKFRVQKCILKFFETQNLHNYISNCIQTCCFVLG